MPPQNPPRLKLVLAFAAVYLIWGSTYLAIRVAIETLPPFLMAGSRFLAAGAVLYAWGRWRGAARPARAYWAPALIAGGLLLLGGNGGVVWAEHRIASGLAALLVASEPLWVTVMDWLRPGGSRPTARVAMGLFIGLIGLVVLVGPDQIMGGERVDLLGAGAVLLAAGCWAAGSLYSKHAAFPAAPQLATGMQMLMGGSLLLAVGLASGEAGQFNPAEFSTASLLALAYLTVFGSLVAFSAYVWLLKVVSPVLAATYAYVNPLVAVLLGWAFADEPLSARTLVAAAIIIGGVVVITTRNKGRAANEPEQGSADVSGPERDSTFAGPPPAPPVATGRPSSLVTEEARG